MTITSLPLYPTFQARKSLSFSQLGTLNQTISSSLSQILELPPEKRDTSSTRAFISSYAKDVALQTLESFIWGDTVQSSRSKDEKVIRQQVLLLAEKLSSTRNESALLDLQTLLDLSIVYSPTSASRISSIFSSTVISNQSLLLHTEEAVLAFTALIDPTSETVASGLYGLRKASHCLRSLLLPSPASLIRLFALNKSFMLAIAKAYDHGLSSIASSYGGFNLSEDAPNASDQVLFVETKVAFVDCFHVLMERGLVEGIVSVGNADDVKVIFDILLDLVNIPSSSPLSTESTPYLNRPLMTDYQDTYDLSRSVTSALRRARFEDSRMELLESQLRAIYPPSQGSGERRRHPGALKLLLHSSGVPLVGIDLKGKGKSSLVPSSSTTQPPAASSSSWDIDVKITQVLDIFPDQSSEYIRALLEHPDHPLKGNPERVIEALLEGTAPTLEDLTISPGSIVDNRTPLEPFVYTQERRNVFDDEAMDLNNVRIGKKRFAKR
jgi:activating signal cointegrator complex subunit 2